MKHTVAIFHGYGGRKTGSWLTWLNNKLTIMGINVIYPSFPFLGNSKIEEWFAELNTYQNKLIEPISLVGHSAGTIFAFYVAQNSGLHFQKLILVCPLNNINGAEINRPGDEKQAIFIRNFVHQNFNFELIKSHVDEFVFILSDNDPNVPYIETKKYFENIFPNSRFVTLTNYGHINEKAGITTLPIVLEELSS